MRFGRWQDLIETPLPDDQTLYSVTTAMIHYGKGVAYAATGDVENAQKQRDLLHAAVDRVPITRLAGDFPHKSKVILQVAIALLDGEVSRLLRTYIKSASFFSSATLFKRHSN